MALARKPPRIENFLEAKTSTGIPCGAAEKNGDPFSRIVNDYGYFPKGSYSINSTHSSTTVRYKTMSEKMSILADVCWFIKADLETGFRQFGTHPVD